MRLFVGIAIPEELQKECVNIQKHLQGKLVPRTNFHYTLKFLGEQSTTTEIIKILDQIKVRHKPFTLRPKNIGAFPSEATPNIVWIGAQCPEFIALAQEINSHLNKFHKEEHKDIVPHLTIAREAKNLPKIKTSFKPFKISSFNLHQSKNGEYTILKEFKLSPQIYKPQPVISLLMPRMQVSRKGLPPQLQGDKK